jgi:hypothetical protein
MAVAPCTAILQVCRVSHPANVPGLSFESSENDGYTTNFKDFIVSGTADGPSLNFESSENGGCRRNFQSFQSLALA